MTLYEMSVAGDDESYDVYFTSAKAALRVARATFDPEHVYCIEVTRFKLASMPLRALAVACLNKSKYIEAGSRARIFYKERPVGYKHSRPIPYS